MLRRLNILLIFLMVFSFFNGSFITDKGEGYLKIIFAAFTLLNFFAVTRAITLKSLYELRGLIYFLGLLTLSWIINLAAAEFTSGEWLNLFTITGIIIITVFFMKYDLEVLLYMSWISLLFSVYLAYASEPVTSWTFRHTGGIGDPNEFSAHMLFLFFISFYLFTRNKSAIFLIISIAASIYGILVAASISAIVILPVLIFFTVINFMTGSRMLRIGLFFFFISISVFLLDNYFNELVEYELISNIIGRTSESGTLQTRIDSWEGGINMFLDKPFTGVGMNQYSSYADNYAFNYLNQASIAPHNVYLKVLSESGIVVFSVFILFLFHLFRRNMHLYCGRCEFLITMASMSMLLMGLTLGITYEKYFWFSIALIINLNFNYDQIRSNNIQS